MNYSILELERKIVDKQHMATLTIEKNGKKYRLQTKSDNEISQEELLTELLNYEN